MKIGYLIPEFPGQTDIFFWREYKALQELGVDVDIVSTRRPPQNIMSHSWTKEAEAQTSYLFPFTTKDYSEAFLSSLTTHPQTWLQCVQIVFAADDLTLTEKAKLFGMIFVATKLVKLAKQKGWTHLHVGSCGNSANIAMFASVLSNLTYSLSMLGPRLETYGPNQKNKWKYAAFGLFQSKSLLQDAVEQLATNLPAKIAFAPVGVNLDVIKRQSSYIPWSGSGICKLYSCGRLNPVKGHNDVIEAVRILRDRGIDAHLKIGGEDEQGGTGYRKVLEQLIQEHNLTNYVELLGAVSEERNREAYQDAHIYVMGSLDEAAGAVATMEAMSMEVPVVMTDVGATSELISNGVDGVLIQPQQPVGMADAIEDLLLNQTTAVNLGKNARQKIASKFHHRLSATTIKQFLDELKLSQPVNGDDVEVTIPASLSY